MIYRVSDMSMKYSRYFAARYVCYNHPITIIYVSDFLHKYCTYRAPDMCRYNCYTTHICALSYTYRVPDMCPITSILTSVCSHGLIILLEVRPALANKSACFNNKLI